MSQAKTWSEVAGPLKKLTEAASSLPSPPVPDDEYSQKLNTLNRTIEGLNEQINGRVQQEAEFDEA